ncbi:MAG: hypothetical protein ABI904_04655 [Chloroflexota bacterium]
MKSIFTVLQDFEKLIYKILMWVILIPKTIVKITLNPIWAHDYIKAELNPEHKPDEHSPFDEYMSPVILLLVVALLPALIFSFLPTFGTTLSSPAEEKPATGRTLLFESLTDFKSSAKDMDYFHTWTVEKVKSDGSYAVISWENHYPGGPANLIEIVDSNTVRDRFLYTFPDLESGEYYINVYAGKYYPFRQDAPLVEVYKSFLKVTVPVKSDEQIVISSDTAKSTGTQGATPGVENLVDQIQKENTIFLALALMIPPLLFALATKLFMGVPIGENTLKENFYVQCYYFSPISLAIWATYYAYYFFTNDAYFYIGHNVALPILLLPPILTALWFFRTEMKTIELERQVRGIKPVLIVTACVAFLGLALYIYFYFQNFQDRIRLLSIQAYPLLSAALLTAIAVAWFRRNKAEKKTITLGTLTWVLASAIVLAGAMRFVSFNAVIIPNAPAGFVDTPIAELPPIQQTQVAELPPGTPTTVAYLPAFADTQMPTLEPTASPMISTPIGEQPTAAPIADTPIVEQPTAVVSVDTPTAIFQPFYTEQFDGNIASWIHFMTSGDESMVAMKVEVGKLAVDLLSLDDKLPWFYLINNDYTYSDVKVEADVTNRGADANGVSLICRYSDIGWYEFVVSNTGTYKIYAMDSAGLVNQGYNELLSGVSPLINPGISRNVLTAECVGNQLSLYVNQTLVNSMVDTQFNFSFGKIGMAVSSPEKLPVGVDLESLTVSQP